jgi:hypothetical protein
MSNLKAKDYATPKKLNLISKPQRCNSLTRGKGRWWTCQKEMDAGGNPYKKKESPKAVNVAEAMNAVMRMGGKIDKVLKASYHPKAELVDLVAKLNQWTAVFRRDLMKA